MADSPQQESKKVIDPLEPWREMREAYMKVWAKSMGETVNSEEYAKTSGAMLEAYLTAAAPFRDAQKKVMVSALEQMNMPSRADFVSLAERLTNVEMLLDDMDTKLSQIQQLAIKAASTPKTEAETKPTTSAAPQPFYAEPQPITVAELEANQVEAETVPEIVSVAAAKATKHAQPRTSSKSVPKGSR